MKKRKKEKSKKKDKAKKSLWRVWLIETIVPAAALALFITTFIGQLYKIPSGSMRPTLQEGDRIMVCKFIYGLRIPFSGKWLFHVRPPKRGDVTVFLFDKDIGKKPKNFIKRVIGTPGERVGIKGGNLRINGQLIDEPPAIPGERFYYNLKAGGQGLFYTEGELTVPDNRFFVLGDNSRNSRDSRWWGFVPLRKVRGKAICIIWPPGRIGLIH